MYVIRAHISFSTLYFQRTSVWGGAVKMDDDDDCLITQAHIKQPKPPKQEPSKSPKGPVIIYCGEGRKKCGGCEHFWLSESVLGKNWEGWSGHRNISSENIFVAATAFFLSLQYSAISLYTSIISKYISYQYENFIVLLKSRHRKIIAHCQVSRGIFCLHTEWAPKNLSIKCCFPQSPSRS